MNWLKGAAESMKGLELSEEYYRLYGAPMLAEKFPSLKKIAVGLTGSGSECFGFDDELSEDHDFEPGFCLFLPNEDTVDRRTAFQLERAYASLPKEFKGLRRNLLAPVGGNRRGVIRFSDFLMEKTGTPDGILSTEEWLRIPEYALAEAVNGRIFSDPDDLVTSTRASLAVYPDDVRLKKLAGSLLLAAQAGQYNYGRCLGHGESAAAQTALFRFTEAAIHAMFLLERRYMPYYKWAYRALGLLEHFSPFAETFEFLLTTENTPDLAETKQMAVEETASKLIDVLQAESLTEAICGDLEKHAYSVNDRITDPLLRNAHILSAV